MHVQIGINPLTWSNDDMPELGADIPLETCLREARQAGYAGIELGHKFPRRQDELQPLLQNHGLKLVSGWHSSHLLEHDIEDELRSVHEHATLLQHTGCKVIVYADTTDAIHGRRDVPLSRRPTLDTNQWPAFGEKLTLIAEQLRTRYNLTMAYHHHMGTFVQSEDDIVALMQNTSDAVGLLLDTGHSTYAGADPVQLTKRFAHRIVHVHCKDVRRGILDTARAKDLSFLEAVLAGVFTVPGDGHVDFKAVVQSLRAANYKGWLVVEAEQDPAVAHPLTYAKLGINTLNRFVQS